MCIVTKLTGPHWRSSSPPARGQDEPPAADTSRDQVASEGGAKVVVDDQDEWDLVTNPGRDADNETGPSRVARVPGYASDFHLEIGRGKWRLSLLSWERRVGSMVQKNRPDCGHAQEGRSES